MFNVFLISKSESATVEELNWIHRMLAEYSKINDGIWLQSLPWTRFEFRWCPQMNLDNGVLGCFSPIYPNIIFLQRFTNGIVNSDGRIEWIEQIFSTIVHELRHAHQWKKSKTLYTVCSLPIIREYTLETDARNEEDKADDFVFLWQYKCNRQKQ